MTAIVSQLPIGSVDVLHIREKHRSAQELMRWYTVLKQLLPHMLVLLNDRVDAAAAVGADGVQLGGGSLTPLEARRLLQTGACIGRSVHSPEEAAEAAREQADFVLFGHIYETGSKAGLPGRGLHALTMASSACPLPTIAIGGITPERTHEVIQAGAAGIAVLSGILLSDNPARQAQRFHEALDKTKPHRKE